jgi:hypothetical protein
VTLATAHRAMRVAARGPICPQRASAKSRHKDHTTLPVFCRSCYQIATAGIAGTARAASIYKDARFSDHAPLTIHYELPL